MTEVLVGRRTNARQRDKRVEGRLSSQANSLSWGLKSLPGKVRADGDVLEGQPCLLRQHLIAQSAIYQNLRSQSSSLTTDPASESLEVR